MRKLRWAGLAVLLLLCLTGTARAEEGTRYIIKIEPQLSLLSEEPVPLTGAEEVWADAGLYVTGDPTLVRELKDSGLLVYAEEDGLLTLQELPDDPLYQNSTQWSLDAVGMEYAWQNGLTGEGVRVGVIDSGLNIAHQDLEGVRIIGGKNYCSLSAITADVTDDLGHGTFVSGIIAAAANNGLDMTGMAPGVELVTLKSFSSKNGTISSAVAAIYAAVDEYGCDVLNLSFGSQDLSALNALKEAIDHAEEQGVIVVAAAGNLSGNAVSTGNDTMFYPASWDTVIGVGATASDGSVASFSRQNTGVFLTAPGASVVSLKSTANTGCRTDSGTSYAAPVVTAAVALALSADPELTRQEIMDLLAGTAWDLSDPGWDAAYGYGLLDLGRFLAAVRQDNGSLTLYETEDGTAFSLYRQGAAGDTRLLAAAYDSAGRLVDLRLLETAETVSLSHVPLAGTEIAVVKVFWLERTGLVPLCAAVTRQR